MINKHKKAFADKEKTRCNSMKTPKDLDQVIDAKSHSFSFNLPEYFGNFLKVTEVMKKGGNGK